jgi:hypothetical protein
MPPVENTDLLLINRAGVDYKVDAGELIAAIPPGEDGEDGEDGEAATVDVGTTTTGAPGTDANVTNSGTTSAAVLDFTIPEGEKGDAATVTAGTTTTSAPGTDANVTNSGTTSAAVFDFTIPKGEKGDPGEDATSIIDVKGTVCLNDTNVPADSNDGDAYVNSCSGTSNAAWAPGIPTGTSHNQNDLVIYNEDKDEWVLLSLGLVNVDLGIDNRGTQTLDITSSAGADVTIPAATNALAGLMTAADKATLDAGGTPNGGTGDRPDSPDIGDLYFDTDLELLLVWNGTSWEPVSPPQAPGQWTRTGTKLAPTNPGDTVAVTAADGTENITLNPNGNITAAGKIESGGNANAGAAAGCISNPEGNFQVARSNAPGTIFQGYTVGTSAPTIVITAGGNITAAGTGDFGGDVTINTDKITLDATDGNISLTGDIINTTVDGNQDIICDGSGLIEVTEYNLNPMEVVTKHDIGTGANEVPLNGFLGTLAYKDDLAIQDGTTVALLPTSPTARVGNITRVTDGAAALTWGATVTGGGTAQYLVWYNGTDWTVLGA